VKTVYDVLPDKGRRKIQPTKENLNFFAILFPASACRLRQRWFLSAWSKLFLESILLSFLVAFL